MPRRLTYEISKHTTDSHRKFPGAPNVKVDCKRKDFRKTPGRPLSTQTSTLKFVDRAQKCFDISYVTSTRIRALWSRHDIVVVPSIPKMTPDDSAASKPSNDLDIPRMMPDDSAGQAARSRRRATWRKAQTQGQEGQKEKVQKYFRGRGRREGEAREGE